MEFSPSERLAVFARLGDILSPLLTSGPAIDG